MANVGEVDDEVEGEANGEAIEDVPAMAEGESRPVPKTSSSGVKPRTPPELPWPYWAAAQSRSPPLPVAWVWPACCPSLFVVDCARRDD